MFTKIRHIIKRLKQTNSYPSVIHNLLALDYSGIDISGIRVMLHVLLWVGFLLLYTLNVKFLYPTTMLASFVFALRNLLEAMTAFYFIFYVVVPFFLLKNRIFPSLVGFVAPFWMCSIVNYFFMIYINNHIYIEDKGLKDSVALIANKPFLSIVSFAAVFQTSIGVLMIVTPCISIKLAIDFMRASTKTLRLERNNLNLEVNFLKAQLNPHFLFNTLNNIYSLSVRNDPQAPELVLQLSDMMRYTLYESNIEKVPLSKEIHFLQDYVELERVRYNKKAVIDFTCDFDLIQSQQIAPLLMFPFVENAFKHGLNTAISNLWLKISVKVDNNILVFDISNGKDAAQYKRPTGDKVGGIGIANTKKRLSILYPHKYELNIKDTLNSYAITMKLNLT